MDPPLLLDPGVVFTCQNSGACCRASWLIGVDDAAWARLRGVRWREHGVDLPAGEAFVPLAVRLPGGERMTFARSAGGACVFLTGDRRCTIHQSLGARAKPQVCREFPYHFVRTPDGVAVGVSFACTAVRGHHGRGLHEQAAEVREVLAGSARVQPLPEPLTLFGSVDIGWGEYRPLEAALLDLLGDAARPFPVGLLAGSALISVCVGLTQMEARARRAGRPPAQTLAGGLAQLRTDGYARLLDIAAGARYPRRPALTYLAPLYTWLELSTRPLSRLALVAALYRNCLRFRRARGRVPDPVTGGPPVDIADVLAVRFDAGHPEVAPFLREYWRHVIFRKTLVPMHGVFRGYQTLLALYSLMKWAARVGALRAGRAVAVPADVREAVRLVEQRFVLHARFTDLFSLLPAVTVLVDRFYRQPSFVRTAALEPDSA